MLCSKLAVHTILLGLLPGVSAFLNTGPLFVWSPQSSNLCSDLSPSLCHDHNSLHEGITKDESFCSFDALLIIDHPGVHTSDLRALQPSCGLARSVKNASSLRQLPNVLHDAWSSRRFLEKIADYCGSSSLDINPEPSEWTLSGNSKHVLMMSMPSLEGSANYRKAAMFQHERLISGALERLAVQAPNHVVIYSGSVLPLEKRQLQDSDLQLDAAEQVSTSSADALVDSGEGSILQRYQLLTPILIVALLVVFFVIVPLLVLGISALASIQSPLRSEVPRGYNAHEKKTQ